MNTSHSCELRAAPVKKKKSNIMATDGASSRSITYTQVSVCNAGGNQAGSAIIWCKWCFVFLLYMWCQMLQVVSSYSPANENNNAIISLLDRVPTLNHSNSNSHEAFTCWDRKRCIHLHNQPSPTTRDPNTTSRCRSRQGSLNAVLQAPHTTGR